MGIIQPIFEMILFAGAVIVCFYLPGKLLSILLKLKLHFLEDLFFSTVVGMMVFTLVSYIFSWLQVEWLIVVTLACIGIFTLAQNGWLPSNFDRKDVKPFFLVSMLAGIFSLTAITSGQFGDTIRLLGPNGHDGLWYLALINELKANFPPEYPGFAGVAFKGYHFFYFFLIAKISNIFHLSPMALLFHFFAVLTSFLWGIGVYTLMFRWSKERSTALWAVFLTFFGGSFAFILPLQGHMGLSLDSAFGMNQGAPSLLNPPYAISIVIILAVLFALHQYFAEKKRSWLIPIVLCIGLVSLFKVYAGMILIGSFVLLTFFEVMKRKFTFLWVLAAIGVLFLATYWFFTDRSSRLFFYPLWAPHKVLEANLPWYGYTEKQYTYSRLSVLRGLVEIEVYALYVFLIGNMGTRLFGLLTLPIVFLRKRALPSMFAITVVGMTGIAILIPLFFIQSGRVFEIIQMTWYFLFFCSLFAAFGFGAFLRLHFHKGLKIILAVLLIAATLPSAYETLKAFVFASGGEISGSYYDAVHFLKERGNYNDTMLILPQDYIEVTDDELRRWYRTTRPDLIAFANKKSYLTYQYFDFPGVDIAPRIDFLKKIIIFTKTPQTDTQFPLLKREIEKSLGDYKIHYIYSTYSAPSLQALDNVAEIYRNEGATIYEVKKSKENE